MSKQKISELDNGQEIKASSGTIVINTANIGTTTPGTGAFTKTTTDNIVIDLNTISSTSGDINIAPVAGSKILMDGTISIDAGVMAGATSITSTTFVGNLTGNASGSAATVTTAAQPAITSLGTLTILDVDNININGNTISASSGAVNITPQAGSAIVLDGTISIDAGVVTGATSISSTTFTGALTGNVTGNASGTAATVTTAAQPAITSVGTLTGLTVKAGTGSATTTGSGSLVLNVTPVSNVGAGEDDLITYTMPASTLVTTGQYLEIEVTGTNANNANSKVIKVYFGSTIVTTLTLAASIAGNWRCKTTVTRTGSSAQSWESEASRTITGGGTAIANTNGTCTETESSTIVIKCTGEAVSDTDVTQIKLTVKNYAG